MTPLYIDGDPYIRDPEGEWVEQHHQQATHEAAHVGGGES